MYIYNDSRAVRYEYPMFALLYIVEELKKDTLFTPAI